MTPEQVKQLLAVIKAQYGPQFQTNAATTQAWCMVLDDVGYDATMPVLREWMKTQEWPPNAAQLRNAVMEQTTALPTANEAWSIVIRRIKDTYPGQLMPDWDAQPEIQQAVRDIGGLRDIRMTEKPEDMRRRFEKAYTERRRQRREQVLGTGDRKALHE